MKNLSRQSQPADVKIEEIISSFANYAFGDIKYLIETPGEEKPIAAFILCSCLIDQLAGYRYANGKMDNGYYYKRFIREYMLSYNPLKLYTDLRCLLVHNYSIGEYISISANEPIKSNSPNSISATHLTAKGLYDDIAKAFIKLVGELRSNTTARKNALKAYDETPPIIGVTHNFWKYSEAEADYLIKYYSDKVRWKLINQSKSLKISKIIKDKVDNTKEPFMLMCASKQYGKNYLIHLDRVTQQLGIDYPIDVLKAAGLYQ